jgi:hypothetical protein
MDSLPKSLVPFEYGSSIAFTAFATFTTPLTTKSEYDIMSVQEDIYASVIRDSPVNYLSVFM